MKKILLIIFILLAAAAFFYFRPDISSTIKNDVANISGNDNFHPDPSNATFIFDDESVTLTNGRNFSTETNEETTLLEETAYGDLNADGKNDAVIFLSSSGGGSGIFVYAAAYVSGPVNYKGTNAVFLGDRVSPQSAYVKNGVVTVNYLDRGPDEPFGAEPTIPVSKQFVYKNGTLEEK